MEPWQRACIRKHLPELVELTVSNTTLQSILFADGILASADLEHLKAIKERNGAMAEAKLLFDLLVSRINAYKAIGKATYESKQTGAFFLLLKGLVEYLLEKSSIEVEEETLNEIIKAECLTEDAWKFFLAKIDKVTLYDDKWIAPPHSLYIPRHISNRVKLNPEVFKEERQDVFVFTGLSRIQLTKLAAPNRTEVSSNVILGKATTQRFIVLQIKEHWDSLQTVWPRPTHLVQYDRYSRDYILLNSTQPSELISNHRPQHLREKSLYLPEDQFLSDVDKETKQRVVCICDTPGMGKTWLLENLARQIQQSELSRVAVVISLHQFAQQTQKSCKDLNTTSSGTTQILLNFLCSFRIMAVILETAMRKNKIILVLFLDGFDEIPEDQFESISSFFNSIQKNEQNVRLFITSRPRMRGDLENAFKAIAYDILPLSEMDQVEYLVRFWRKSSKLNDASESQLHKIREFALACLQKLKNELTKDIGKIMGIPLQCFMLATVNENNAILYCSLKESSNATEFVSSTSMYDMYRIYLEMGLDRATKHQETFNYEVEVTKERLKITSDSSGSISTKRKQLKAFHVWKALQLLAPKVAEFYFYNRKVTKEIPLSHVLACGLMQNCTSEDKSSNEVAFIHRTIAEYLVAEYFAEIVSNRLESTNLELIDNLLLEFFSNILCVKESAWNRLDAADFYCHDAVYFDIFEFKNSTTVYFLNTCLQDKPVKWTTKINKLLKVKLNVCLLKFQPYKIISACMISNYINILRLVKNSLTKQQQKPNDDLREVLVYPAKISGTGPQLDKYYMSCCAYLCHAAETSNIPILEEIYGILEDCLHENLINICSKMHTGFATPLHYAVKRHNYSLVEFFVEHISLSERCLLYVCLNDENETPLNENKCAMEICQMPLEKDRSILGDKYIGNRWLGHCEIGGIVLEVRDVKCINFLVKRGADIRAKFIEGGNVDTVLTRNATFMNRDELHELCLYLIFEIRAYDLFKQQLPFRAQNPTTGLMAATRRPQLHPILSGRLMTAIFRNQFDPSSDTGLTRRVTYPKKFESKPWSDPLPMLVRRAGHATLDLIFQIPGIDINNRDKEGNNLILDTIKHGCHEDLVRYLAEHGIDLFARNDKGENSLHLSAALGNTQMAEFLLSSRLPLEDQDNLGRTALHVAVDCFEMVKYLISRNANIMAVNPKKEDSNIAHLLLTKFNPNQIYRPDPNIIASYLISLPQGDALFRMTNKFGRTPLHEWIGSGTLHPKPETIETILKTSGEDINATDSERNTMFMRAAGIENSLTCLKCLSEHGANGNIVNIKNRNALHISVDKGIMDASQYFVSIGISLEQRDSDGFTPLLLATYLNRVDMVKYFITQNANLLATDNKNNNVAHILLAAIQGSDNISQIIEYLISFDIQNNSILFRMTNKHGMTPLHALITSKNSHADPQTITRILQHSLENVNKPDNYGNTMLLNAVANQLSVDVLKCLISFGADPDCTNYNGRNLLHILVEKYLLQYVSYFKTLAVSPNKQDIHGLTPLHLAARCRCLDLIKFLIAQHADVLVVDNNGNNIVHHVLLLKYNDEYVIRNVIKYFILLPQASQLFQMTNQDGRTPLHAWIASENINHSPEMIELMQKISDENMNAIDINGNTMFLTAASKHYSLVCLKCLTKLGANHNVTNNDGNNALHLTSWNEVNNFVGTDFEIVKYLMSLGCNVTHQNKYGLTPLQYAVPKPQPNSLESHIFRLTCLLDNC